MSESNHLEVVAREFISPDTGKPKFICNFCSISFGKRSNLSKHLKKFHQLQIEVQANQTCGLCDEKFRTITILHEHLQNQHSITLKFVDETFYCENDFHEWKNKIEKDSLSLFVLRNTTDQNESGIILSYYSCHRSGPFRRKRNRIRQVKASGSIKTGHTCPAFMKVSTQTEDGISEIKVRYQSVHVGHDLETRTLRLSKEDRANLAACLKLGIPMDKILEQARQNCSPTNRYSFLTRKHLHNIRRDFKISTNNGEKMKANDVQNKDLDDGIKDSEMSGSSNGYQDYLEIEVSNQEEIQENEKTQEHDRNTAIASLLLLKNQNYSEDFKNKKVQIVNQLKKLQLRIEEWDPACPLPDVEEHIRALNAFLDISASSNTELLNLQRTPPIMFKAPVREPPIKRRKVTRSKKGSKKNSVFR